MDGYQVNYRPFRSQDRVDRYAILREALRLARLTGLQVDPGHPALLDTTVISVI